MGQLIKNHRIPASLTASNFIGALLFFKNYNNNNIFGDSQSFSREEFDRNLLPDKGDNNNNFLGSSRSFSREEFKRSFALLKGDS